VADQRYDVVVVDDNPLLVSVLSEIFKEYGCTVRTASDGFEALAIIRDRVPNILISDLNIPRMTGFELLSIIRRRFPMIAVIAMSGYGLSTSQANGDQSIDPYHGAIDSARFSWPNRSCLVQAALSVQSWAASARMRGMTWLV
jgi:CheY-like chemotaxis protein